MSARTISKLPLQDAMEIYDDNEICDGHPYVSEIVAKEISIRSPDLFQHIYDKV